MSAEAENDTNKVGAVYSKLKDLVTTNQFKPNEQLNINKLSERLAVSMTPVREALIKLARGFGILLQDAQQEHPPSAAERWGAGQELVDDGP